MKSKSDKFTSLHSAVLDTGICYSLGSKYMILFIFQDRHSVSNVSVFTACAIALKSKHKYGEPDKTNGLGTEEIYLL